MNDSQDCHQQQEPQQVADAGAMVAIMDGLEEADQVLRSGLIIGRRAGFGYWQEEIR